MGPTSTAKADKLLTLNKEIDLRPEFNLSPKNRQTFSVDSLIRLSQIRQGVNPIQDDLNSSIARRGVMHDCQIARLSEETFIDYVCVVNSLWGSQYNADDYSPYEDGLYNVIIAGHSRHIGAEEVQKQNPDIRYTLDCIPHVDPTYEEIIAIQLEENLHSTPLPERQAKAVVEIYRMGLLRGMWSEEKEFLERPDVKLSESQLRNALYYAKLPEEIQTFVQGGTLSYTLAVELGKVMEDVRKYFGYKFLQNNADTEINEEAFDKIDAMLAGWLGLTIAHIQNNKLRGKKALGHVKGSIKDLGDEMGQLSFNSMADPTELMISYRKAEARKYANVLREITVDKLDKVARAVMMHVGLLYNDADELIAELQTRTQSTIGRIGGMALKGSGAEVSEEQILFT